MKEPKVLREISGNAANTVLAFKLKTELQGGEVFDGAYYYSMFAFRSGYLTSRAYLATRLTDVQAENVSRRIIQDTNMITENIQYLVNEGIIKEAKMEFMASDLLIPFLIANTAADARRNMGIPDEVSYYDIYKLNDYFMKPVNFFELDKFANSNKINQ
jgi:hypothetical protein